MIKKGTIYGGILRVCYLDITRFEPYLSKLFKYHHHERSFALKSIKILNMACILHKIVYIKS